MNYPNQYYPNNFTYQKYINPYPTIQQYMEVLKFKKKIKTLSKQELKKLLKTKLFEIQIALINKELKKNSQAEKPIKKSHSKKKHSDGNDIHSRFQQDVQINKSAGGKSKLMKAYN